MNNDRPITKSDSEFGFSARHHHKHSDPRHSTGLDHDFG